MRNLFFSLLCILPVAVTAQNLATQFEQSGGKESPVYADIIKWWQALDAKYDKVKMQTMGPSDAGFPLHLVTVSMDRDFNFESLRKKNKRIINR